MISDTVIQQSDFRVEVTLLVYAAKNIVVNTTTVHGWREKNEKNNTFEVSGVSHVHMHMWLLVNTSHIGCVPP